jgi:hypothetical protein
MNYQRSIFMNLPSLCVALILAALAAAASAQSRATPDTPLAVFGDKPLAAPQIHVENLSQFTKWDGKPIPQGDYGAEGFKKKRLGTVAFSSSLKVHIDLIENNVHGDSYYELIDVKSASILGKYWVRDLTAKWYFSGNGTAYLNQQHLSLCGPRHTRKIAQQGKTIAEVVQPIIFLGAETEVLKTTPLFESPTSRKVVATVTAESTVWIVGLQPGEAERSKMALLVKTPFGLTGWHVFDRGDAALAVYTCG